MRWAYMLYMNTFTSAYIKVLETTKYNLFWEFGFPNGTRGVNCQPKKPTDYPLSFDEKKSLSNCHKLSQTISTGLRRNLNYALNTYEISYQ